MELRGILKGVSSLEGLGASRSAEGVRIYYLQKEKQAKVYCSVSSDGLTFDQNSQVAVLDSRKRNLNIGNLSAMRQSTYRGKVISVLNINKGLLSSILVGVGENSKVIPVTGRIMQINETAGIVPEYKHNGNYIAYSGGRKIRLSTSADLKNWRINKKPVLTLSHQGGLEIGAVEKISQGILVIYFEKIRDGGGKYFYSIRAAIFDDNNPEKLVFQTEYPIWEEPGEWNNLKITVKPFGLVTLGEKLISYWTLNGNELLAIIHKKKASVIREKKEFPEILLKKNKKNPIIRPRPDNFWESKATFNPAAIFDEGKVHIVYRAVGDHDMSMLGYASSRDGVHIDYRSRDPVYVPTEPFEFQPQKNGAPIPISAYASGGGGYGGVEDPRMTKIGNKIYMTYVAYDGSGPPRVALTSIKTADFHNQQWNWARPVLISKPNVVDKNAVIFPEKIDGKYVIMHRIFPDILIDFVDSLDFEGDSYLPGKYHIAPRKNFWDSRKVGAGAPPIKTDDGWLLIYQGVGDDNPSHYRIGAMLLDKDDPTRVLARTNNPILEPLEDYENQGYKSGVVYPCGAVVVKDDLLVYYGGADTVSCVAKARLPLFLEDLKSHDTALMGREFASQEI